MVVQRDGQRHHPCLLERWLLQTGFTYDSTPVSKTDRTADMPIDAQVRVAVGGQYAWNKRLTVSGALEYAFLGDAESSDTSRFGLIGDYSRNDIFIFSIHANWRFGT